MARRGTSASGTNYGARGPLPRNVTTQAGVYTSGRGSAFNPGATVRRVNPDGSTTVVSGSAKS